MVPSHVLPLRAPSRTIQESTPHRFLTFFLHFTSAFPSSLLLKMSLVPLFGPTVSHHFLFPSKPLHLSLFWMLSEATSATANFCFTIKARQTTVFPFSPSSTLCSPLSVSPSSFLLYIFFTSSAHVPFCALLAPFLSIPYLSSYVLSLPLSLFSSSSSSSSTFPLSSYLHPNISPKPVHSFNMFPFLRTVLLTKYTSTSFLPTTIPCTGTKLKRCSGPFPACPSKVLGSSPWQFLFSFSVFPCSAPSPEKSQ